MSARPQPYATSRLRNRSQARPTKLKGGRATQAEGRGSVGGVILGQGAPDSISDTFDSRSISVGLFWGYRFSESPIALQGFDLACPILI